MDAHSPRSPAIYIIRQRLDTVVSKPFHPVAEINILSKSSFGEERACLVHTAEPQSIIEVGSGQELK